MVADNAMTGWSPANRRALDRVLSTLGQSAAGYNPDKKPYAVFDWDNTCIMNDAEEALLLYQAEQLRFKLTPTEFAHVLRLGVPEGLFHADCSNVQGQPVDMQDLTADIDEAYSWLYARCATLGGTTPLAELVETPQYQNFCAKFYFMYGALCDSYPMEVGYKWIIYFYSNFSTAELQSMVLDAVAHNLALPLQQAAITSSAELPGRAGQLAPAHFYGMRVHGEMAELMRDLRTHGFDVFVSTASLDDVVRAYAGHPGLGYDVPPENVLGLKLEMLDGKYTPVYRKDWHFNWGPGKTLGIQKHWVTTKGYGPALVFGDSDGDAWMMKDFADTQLGVIINRLHPGQIGLNSQQAVATLGQPNARFVLQGRDEARGCFNGQEQTLKYGRSAPQLLV